MPRPRKADRPTSLNIHLPETLRAKLDLHLFSLLEERVPQGAYQRFIVPLIEAELNRLHKEQPCQSSEQF